MGYGLCKLRKSFYLIYGVYMCMPWGAYGVSSVLLPNRLQELNSGCWTWQQAPLPMHMPRHKSRDQRTFFFFFESGSSLMPSLKQGFYCFPLLLCYMLQTSWPVTLRAILSLLCHHKMLAWQMHTIASSF